MQAVTITQVTPIELETLIQNSVRKVLSENPLETVSQDNPGELLTIREASSFLKLSVATLYQKVSRSEIPSNKQGKRLYFLRSELINWIKSGSRKTIAEIEAEAIRNLSRNRK